MQTSVHGTERLKKAPGPAAGQISVSHCTTKRSTPALQFRQKRYVPVPEPGNTAGLHTRTEHADGVTFRYGACPAGDAAAYSPAPAAGSGT